MIDNVEICGRFVSVEPPLTRGEAPIFMAKFQGEQTVQHSVEFPMIYIKCRVANIKSIFIPAYIEYATNRTQGFSSIQSAIKRLDSLEASSFTQPVFVRLTSSLTFSF